MGRNIASCHIALDHLLCAQGLDNEGTDELAAKVHAHLEQWIKHGFMRWESQLRHEGKRTMTERSRERENSQAPANSNST